MMGISRRRNIHGAAGWWMRCGPREVGLPNQGQRGLGYAGPEVMLEGLGGPRLSKARV